MTDIVTRGNTVNFSFSFLDSTGAAASVASATLQIEYPGRDRREKATAITLTESGSNWIGTWDSSVSRKGWVKYHAHAIDDTGAVLTEDGRLELSANMANYQHDTLPGASTTDYDYSVGD